MAVVELEVQLLLLGEVQKKILVSSGGVTYLVDRLEQRGAR